MLSTIAVDLLLKWTDQKFIFNAFKPMNVAFRIIYRFLTEIICVWFLSYASEESCSFDISTLHIFICSNFV